MLFEPMTIIVGGVTLVAIALEKTLEGYGFHGISTALKILIPVVAFAAGIYFLETNVMLRWIR